MFSWRASQMCGPIARLPSQRELGGGSRSRRKRRRDVRIDGGRVLRAPIKVMPAFGVVEPEASTVFEDQPGVAGHRGELAGTQIIIARGVVPGSEGRSIKGEVAEVVVQHFGGVERGDKPSTEHVFES
jgi:hypothetical protein